MELYNDETLTRVNSNIELIQKKDGLTFGTDAYLLSAYVRGTKYASTADLGCGTGIISLLLASRGIFSKIYAVDIQKRFCDIAERNVHHNGFDNIIETVCCDVRDFSAECDVVFCNPPYMKNGSGKLNFSTAKQIARHEIYGDIDSFTAAASRILRYGGLFYAVYRADRMTDLLVSMRKNKIEPKRMTMVYPDDRHAPCMLLVQGKKGANPSMYVTKPLLLKINGEDSDDIKYIYEKGEFGEQFEAQG